MVPCVSPIVYWEWHFLVQTLANALSSVSLVRKGAATEVAIRAGDGGVI